MLLDNCPAHKTSEIYSNIEIVFLPPNSTGILQPMDLGIIKASKNYFERHKFDFIKTKIENKENKINVHDAYKEINLANVIAWTDLAWNSVTKETIKNCF